MKSRGRTQGLRILTPLPQGRLQRVARWALFVLLTAVVGGCGAIVIGYLALAPTIPAFNSIDDYQPKLGTRIYSADNQLVAEFAAERRVMVAPEQLPPLLLQAFIAAEDQRFYSHSGIDLLGIVKALTSKVADPTEKLRGASTITQQVAKSLLAMQESFASASARTLARKMREAILARRLESVLTKRQIIYIYLHEIFLGHKAYGVQAAAEHYFRKNVWRLSLAEMATLAGLPQRPSDYSPFSRPEAAKNRRRYVLRRMVEDGYITAQEREQAADEELVVYPREEPYLRYAPYYTEQVRREIIDRYGERALLEDGFQVYTALNLGFQHYARQSIDQALLELDRRQGFRGPLAHLDTQQARALFKSRLRAEMGLTGAGERPQLKAGEVYLGLVTEIGEKRLLAKIDVAGVEGYLPVAGMRWAREPDPLRRVDGHYVRHVDEALKPGDVISVAITTRAQLARDIYGSGAMDSVPDQGVLLRLEQEPIAQAALLSVDPASGYVLAQVGGYEFTQSTYNRAVQACREPGSAFKPVVYTAAIDKLDYTPSTMIEDKPLVFDDPDHAVRWKPNNAGLQFRGEIPLRTCLKDSINTPAIRVAADVGISDVIKNARRLGITTDLKRELGTALGSSCTTLFDLIQVYVTLNQMGERRALHFIRRIVDRDGNVLEDHSVPWDPTLDLAARLDRAYLHLVRPQRQVLDPQTAFVMISLLRNVIEEGTGVAASNTGHVVAGKTGTTNDAFDAWFMGFTPKIVTGVWIGHDQKERPLGVGEQGARTALPAWVTFLDKALRDYTQPGAPKLNQGDFVPPPGVVRVSIDPDTGLLARPDSLRSVLEYYRAGTEPTELTPDKSKVSPTEFDIFGADTPL